MERQQHGEEAVQEVKSGDLLDILSKGYDGMSGHHTYLGPAACELIERVRQGDEVAQYGLVALAESGKLVAQAAVVELGDGYVPQTVLQNARKVVKQVRRWRTDGDPQPAAQACKRIRATGNFGESASVRPREYVAQPPARTRKRKLGQANLGDHPSPGLVCRDTFARQAATLSPGAKDAKTAEEDASRPARKPDRLSPRATWFREKWKTAKHGPWDEYGYLREGWSQNRQGFPYRGDVCSEPGAVQHTWDAYGVVMIVTSKSVQELEKEAEQELLANDGASNAVRKLMALAREGNEEAHEAVRRVSTKYWSAKVARWTLLRPGCC